jgi:ribosomal protein S18 acetylase RimI-like enzyme
MIREISQDEVFKHFYRLAAEVECGNHFDFSNPRHEEWLRRKIAIYFYSGAKFFALFLEEGTPLGYAALLIEDKLEDAAYSGQTSELLEIGVLGEFRGKGYGKILLDHAEGLSKERDAYCMYIKTWAKDYKVIAFYGRCGFVPVATLPDVYGPGDEGDIYMRKIIRK